jgi:filamentous hemagglutinin family protein
MSPVMASRNSLPFLSLLVGLFCLSGNDALGAGALPNCRGTATVPLPGANQLLLPSGLDHPHGPDATKVSVKPAITTLPVDAPKSTLAAQILKIKGSGKTGPKGIQSLVPGSTSSSVTGRLSANIGGADKLTSAPAAAFGFLPQKAVVNPTSGIVSSLPATTIKSPGGLKQPGIPSMALKSDTVLKTTTVAVGSGGTALLKSTGSTNTTLPVSITSLPSPNPSTKAKPAVVTAPVSSLAVAPGTNSISASPSTVISNLHVASPTAPAAVPRKTVPAANVALDNSLGQSGTVAITGVPGAQDYAVDQTAGLLVGSNLFFSFAKFSLATGESATFNGPMSVQNVLARVTGGFPSTIDGTINVNIPGANFYLMNPAGVVFTSGAFLNVPGSVIITTANYLKLADGNRFTASPSNYDHTLSTAPVSAFGFLPGKSTPPGAITISPNTFLFTTNLATNMIVVGGNETIDWASVSAPAGQLTFVSVAGPGEVPADPATLRATPLKALPQLGTFTLQNLAEVSATSFMTGGIGNVEIDAARVNILNGSTVDASALLVPGGSGVSTGNVLVRCQTLLVDGASSIQAEASGFGTGGSVVIQAQNMTLRNSSQVLTVTFDQASGGSIVVEAGNLDITGSFIDSSANGSGAAGNITVTATNLSIAGSPSFLASGILAESGFAGLNGETFTGRGGDISVQARQLTLTNGGQISATTFGPGQGGNVSVSANDISVSGYTTFFNGTSTQIFQSGILASSQLPGNEGAGGAGGNVTISTNSLEVSSNGLITASTVGSGNSGSVAINASSIILNGNGATYPTGVAATTDYQTGGRAGDIDVKANSLQVLGGAEINAATSGTGAGGDVSVAGGSVLVAGIGSTITAQTTAQQGGTGGSLRFNVGSLTVSNGGEVSASTLGSGQGGSVQINTNQLTVESGGSITADTSGMNGMVMQDPSVQNLSLTLNVTATSDAALRAFLENPAGDSIVVLNLGDATGANLAGTMFSDSGATPITGGTAPYTGTFLPATPFSLLNGAAANGTWTLQVAYVGGESATLQSWSLGINGKQFDSGNISQSFAGFSNSFTLPVTIPATQTMVKAGSGGSIQINAGTINLSNGGSITASTHGDGAAGSLNIRSNSINIDGSRAASDTGLFASADAGSTGRGGSISVSTSQLQITGSGNSSVNSGIVARSQTNAPAGDITVRTDDLFLNSGAVISSANLAAGPAGSVTVNAGGSITLQNGSLITVVAQGSNAGMIKLSAGQNIELSNGSTITASAGLGGGSIMIQAGNNFQLTDSSIVATAGTGAGGNITIDPEFIILNNGLISANAAAGAGGNILIVGQYFFDNESPITATGTTAGTVQITTLPLDIVNALADLQGGFIDLSHDLQESCTMRLGVDASSFLVIGRGGVEDSPGDPQEELRARLRKKERDKGHAR